MIPTPLLLDFSATEVFPQPPPTYYPHSDAELERLTDNTTTPTQYFIRIHAPENYNQIHGLRQRSLQITLQPSLNNQVRLSLLPTIGYGKDSAYRVEYFEWSKPYYIGRTTKRDTKATTKKVYEEWWRIPTLDRVWIYDYFLYYNYRPAYKFTEETTLTRSNSSIDPLTSNMEIIDIRTIEQDGTPFTEYQIVDDSLFWKPYFIPRLDAGELPYPPPTPPAPTIGIQWTGSSPAPGTQYQVTYVKPFRLEDIVYLDYHGKTIVDVNPYVYLNIFPPFIPYF